MMKLFVMIDRGFYIFERIICILKDRPPMKRLQKEGMNVGKNVQVQNGVHFDISHCWLISIGNNVTIAPYVKIIAHDASTKNFLRYTKIGKIEIGNNVFIGANSVVLPGVKIGNNVIIGANSTVTKNIPDNTVYAGSPARMLFTMNEYLKKEKSLMEVYPVFNNSYTRRNHISNEKKCEMNKALQSNTGFVE